MHGDWQTAEKLLRILPALDDDNQILEMHYDIIVVASIQRGIWTPNLLRCLVEYMPHQSLTMTDETGNTLLHVAAAAIVLVEK